MKDLLTQINMESSTMASGKMDYSMLLECLSKKKDLSKKGNGKMVSFTDMECISQFIN